MKWQAVSVAPRRVLVVTYKQIAAAFVGVSGADTGHFKAIASLDVYKDVALLIVIGRLLPGDDDLGQLTSTHLGHIPTGGHRKVRRGLLMRDGSRRAISAMEYEDPKAELLRAAVCDDVVIQAIGRGRGVNRTEANPLEVQVLADVALPLTHDRVVARESCVPDVFQKMLLAGVAVDSQADAAALHPNLFNNAEAAKKAFQRAAFRGQIPKDNPYREMSLKSASCRRIGRGRSRQRAWWVAVNADEAKQRLEVTIGPFAKWSWGLSSFLLRKVGKQDHVVDVDAVGTVGIRMQTTGSDARFKMDPNDCRRNELSALLHSSLEQKAFDISETWDHP